MTKLVEQADIVIARKEDAKQVSGITIEGYKEI